MFTLSGQNPRGVAPFQVLRSATYEGLFIKKAGVLKGHGYFLLLLLPNAAPETRTTTNIQSGAVLLKNHQEALVA